MMIEFDFQRDKELEAMEPPNGCSDARRVEGALLSTVHSRRMVMCEKPVAAAVEWIDQCVASFGVERSMRLAAIWSSSIVRGLPGRTLSRILRYDPSETTDAI